MKLSVSEAKKLFKQRQREFTFAEQNWHKAIVLNVGINNKNKYELFNTADIEKINYYKLDDLPKYTVKNAASLRNKKGAFVKAAYPYWQEVAAKAKEATHIDWYNLYFNTKEK